MNRLRSIFLLLAIPLIWISCDKEIDINDEYKDITIVYGLINPNDSISYLRIEKAFLSDGDIYQTALVPDSNLYGYKLNARIFSNTRDITFDTVTIYNKNEGIFYAPKMVVYQAVTKNLLNTDDEYFLEITNPKTGEVITSKSKLINGNRISYSYPRPGGKIDFINDKDVEYESIKNARTYQVNIRFHYAEETINDPDSRTYHYVDWVFSTQQSQFLQGGEEMKTPYNGDEWFANLENNIPAYDSDPSHLKVRYYGDCETIISIADETFYTYMEINQPSASLVIDRPEFTNVENGYGIFASRSFKSQYNAVHERSSTKLKQIESLNFARSMFEFE